MGEWNLVPSCVYMLMNAHTYYYIYIYMYLYMYTFATARVIFLSLLLRQLNFKSKVSIEAPKPVAADLSSMPKACVGSFERIQMKQHMYIHTCIRLYVYMCMCICV